MARILIIDDDDIFRVVLRQPLERAGYDIMEASNGKKGLELLRQKPCDLVITDIYMPEKEGIETIQLLKLDFPDINIIAMSGGGPIGTEEILLVAKKLGANRTFSKPFDHDELLKAVEELLS